MFNKFDELLKAKSKLKKIKFEYMWVRDTLQSRLQKINRIMK